MAIQRCLAVLATLVAPGLRSYPACINVCNRCGSPVASMPSATSVPTLVKLRNDTARIKLIVVMNDRKNLTRMLLNDISSAFLNGSTTCRATLLGAAAGDSLYAWSFMVMLYRLSGFRSV